MLNNYLLVYLRSKPFQSLIVNFIKAMGTFALIKIIAVYGGAASMASFSNFQNIIALMLLLVTFSAQTGLTSATARNNSDQAPIFSMILISILLSPIALALFYILSEKLILSGDILSTNDYLFYLGFLIIPFAINSMLVACEVGIQRYSNIFFNYILIGASPFIFLIFSKESFYLTEVLFWFCIGNWIGVLFLFSRIKINIINIFRQSLQFRIIRPVISYGVMSGIMGIMVTLCALITRQYLSASEGVDLAGQWDALVKIALLFQFVVVAPLTSTAFPILVRALDDNKSNIRSLIVNRIKVLFIVSTLAILICWIFSDWIIWIIFSSDFLIIAPFLVLIISMESLKAIGGIFSLIPWASRKFSVQIINQLIFTMIILIGLIFLSNKSMLTLSSVTWLYFIASCFYLIYISTWFFLWKKKNPQRI